MLAPARGIFVNQKYIGSSDGFKHSMHMPRLKRTRDRIRTALISVLLIASLFLVGLLSVETFNAVDSHERLANDVLLNYTELAADEFERRSSIIAFRGLYPVIIRLTNLPPAEKLPEPQSLPEIMKSVSPEELGWASTLAQSLFRYDNKTDTLVHNGYTLSPAIQDQLLDDLMESGTQEQSIRTFHANYENQDFNFVYSWVEDSYAVGILVDNVTVGRTVEYIVDNFPLLPQALVEGELGNEHILLKVTNLDNQTLFLKGVAGADTFFIKRPAESELAELYGGLNLEVGIDPLVADQLVIGGLPQSRLPFLAGLWTLTILTIAIALILFRRERALINLRSDFVSRVSHELRTPLTQIIMFAQTLILKRMRSESDRDRALSVIDSEAQRLSMLVENILQFSRSDKGGFSLTLQPVAIVPLVREITDQFRSLLKNDHCLSVTANTKENLEISLDKQAFQQMVINLLDNAVKYSPSDSGVDISVTSKADKVELAVSDRGPGISKSEKRKIWEPYYRISRKEHLAIGGNGIGLSVVKELAKLHHADVAVIDRVDGGSIFKIIFQQKDQA